MKHADSDIKRIDYIELCNTIRKKIKKEVVNLNKRLVESETEKRNSNKTAKRTLMIGFPIIYFVVMDNI